MTTEPVAEPAAALPVTGGLANLLVRGNWRLASGAESTWRIDCDVLADADIETCAWMLSRRLPKFASVEGVPTGGLRLAAALRPYVTEGPGPLLIVDDVLTTGASMEKQRAGREAIAAAIFMRCEPGGLVPGFVDWLTAVLFVVMPEIVQPARTAAPETVAL